MRTKRASFDALLDVYKRQRLDPSTVTPQQVFDAVCHMRTTKLPDPKVNGNAGSFFKHPVVSDVYKRQVQALIGITGRKAHAGGLLSQM